MKQSTLEKTEKIQNLEEIDLKRYSGEISEQDQKNFEKVISTDLTEKQKQIILNPPRVYRKEETVLAIHWHPEHIPMELLRKRINNTFPNKKNELIIPTQHNIILTYDEYAGAEIDCYSKEFKRKVQLLFHFRKERIKKADKLKSMIQHTFNYRSGQLFELMDTLIDSKYELRLQNALHDTPVSDTMIKWIRIHTKKLRNLVEKNELIIPTGMIKNKLLREYFNSLSDQYCLRIIETAQAFIKSVKKIVKKGFNNDFFYSTHEMIEEARSNGAGIIVPHPEQFWPILLADYDIDGYEVWNPQSMDYTEFLISVVNRLNKTSRYSSRPLLITMGDDCHMGEKTKPQSTQNKEKASREIGVQPGWEDLAIRKNLIRYNINKNSAIQEYKKRLT